MKRTATCLLASLLIVFLFIPVNSLSAQESTTTAKGKLVRIDTKDGQTFKGVIEKQTAESLTLKTSDGLILTIPGANIEQLEEISEQEISGKYGYKDPNDTRLFFAPTARTLKQGHGYFSDYELFFPSFGVGAFDFLSIGGGISIFPGVGAQLYYIAPKVRVLHLNKLDVAVGTLYMNATSNSGFGGGIAWGLATYGTSDLAATVGAGWGYSGESFADKPVILLGGEARVSQSIKLLGEAWIIPDENNFPLLFGIRFFGRQLAADLGMIYITGSKTSGWPFIPWVGFAYNFGVK